MHRNVWLSLIATAFVGTSSSCCEQQWNHSVRKMWADYNTLRAPALYFEQDDHLPYPAAQVAYYRWMYDKDPGHQLRALGPVTPPQQMVPQCVPPGSEPFEYQVAYPNAVPNQTDSLWGQTLPEPINVPRPPADSPNGGANSPKNLPDGPLMTPVPPPLGEAAPMPSSTGNSANKAGRGLGSSSLPPISSMPGTAPQGFDNPQPQPQPIDEDVPPLLGPAAQDNPNLRLTTAPATKSGTPTATNALWPR